MIKKLLLVWALVVAACGFDPEWQDPEIQVITEATLGIPPAPQMIREQVSVSTAGWSTASAPLLFRRNGTGEAKDTTYYCGYYDPNNNWVVDNHVVASRLALVNGPCSVSGTNAVCAGVTYPCASSVSITTPLTYWETAPATGNTGWGTTWGSGSTRYYKALAGTWYAASMLVYPQPNGQIQLACTYGAAWPYLTLEVSP